MIKIKPELNNDVVCPLCHHDEYLLSESGEKFTCGSCGFHTKQFKSIIKNNHHHFQHQRQHTYVYLSNSVYH
ncbi:hypothetical protein FCV43_15850 [Vibrio genomosp. F6]|nr:hypothetical protein [Vibrio sp. 03-59-1]RBW65014.1 hypothetical protein DS893_11180 [Vibrionales bacterium C3R12]TKF18972.1 hypothetical protein FCV43_15850 [Vibrio genomosp. F6]